MLLKLLKETDLEFIKKVRFEANEYFITLCNNKKVVHYDIIIEYCNYIYY